MKTKNQPVSALSLKYALAAAVLALLAATLPAPAAGRNPNPGILPVGSSAFGKTLAEWSAEWWKLGIEDPVAGNPFVEGGVFPLSKNVWGLAAPLGSATFYLDLPAGKALFVAGITSECSSLEPPDSGFHGDTEEEQAACAAFWADHIVDLFIEIDGARVNDVASYRVVSTQFSFTAPDPNILGVPGGGTGTGVADGYYVMLAPLSKGVHKIRISGAIHVSTAEGDPFDLDLVVDNTFNITVGKP
jgi:hypothetical protein